MAKNIHAVALGRRGGRANKGKTSVAKKRSGAENMAKARAALQRKFPLQPIYKDEHGTIRFRPNKIVEFLLDSGTLDMNQLAVMEFADDEREQFAQLIGYSVSGFADLSYVSDKTYFRAESLAAKMRKQ